jgi:hypothetical protein
MTKFDKAFGPMDDEHCVSASSMKLAPMYVQLYRKVMQRLCCTVSRHDWIVHTANEAPKAIVCDCCGRIEMVKPYRRAWI